MFCEFGASRVKETLEVSLQGGNIRFLSFLNTLLCCSIVVLCS
jgi:hypothetical protein